MAAGQPRTLDDAPRDRWFLASALTGDVVPVSGRYPHICGIKRAKADTETQTVDLVYRERDCAACARARGRTVR